MDINNQAQSYQGLLNMLNGKPASNGSENAQQRIVDTLPYSSDSVSLSYKGAKLSMISSEFFSGTIKSTDIPALTERLFQDGFINESELRALGGVKPDESTSQIKQSINFLNTVIMNEGMNKGMNKGMSGNSEDAKNLMLAVDSLQRMDEASTAESRRNEREAYEFVASYHERLQEKQAPTQLIENFEQVLQVFEALDTVRKNESKTGALASYASVQETYDGFQNESQKNTTQNR